MLTTSNQTVIVSKTINSMEDHQAYCDFDRFCPSIISDDVLHLEFAT